MVCTAAVDHPDGPLTATQIRDMFDWTKCAATPQQQARLVPRSKDVARAISVGLSPYGTPTAAAMSPYGTDAMSPLSPGSSYGTAPTSPEALDAEEGGVAASEAISDG